MEKKDKKVLEDLKENAKETVEKVKDYAKEVKSTVKENHDFRKFAVRVKRINSKIFNFDMMLHGIFDQSTMTLTYQVKDEFHENEMIEITGKTYQVVSVAKNSIMVPIILEGVKQEIECKVATLQPTNLAE